MFFSSANIYFLLVDKAIASRAVFCHRIWVILMEALSINQSITAHDAQASSGYPRQMPPPRWSSIGPYLLLVSGHIFNRAGYLGVKLLYKLTKFHHCLEVGLHFHRNTRLTSS